MILITDKHQQVDEWQYTNDNQNHLMNLLDMSSYEGKQREFMENEINDVSEMDQVKYSLLSTCLYANQLDRISNGFNYSATDILKHLKKLR